MSVGMSSINTGLGQVPGTPPAVGFWGLQEYEQWLFLSDVGKCHPVSSGLNLRKSGHAIKSPLWFSLASLMLSSDGHKVKTP